MLEKASDSKDIGVIIFEERAGRGMPGSIKKSYLTYLDSAYDKNEKEWGEDNIGEEDE